MPIYEAPQVSKNPVFGFGDGDLFVAAGADSADPKAGNRYLLIYKLRQGGRIGTVEETGRDDGIPEGSTTADCPADLALYFATEDSLDQVLAVLLSIKDGFRERSSEGATAMAMAKGAPSMTDLMVPPESITPAMLELELEDAPPIQTADPGEAFQGPSSMRLGLESDDPAFVDAVTKIQIEDFWPGELAVEASVQVETETGLQPCDNPPQDVVDLMASLKASLAAAAQDDEFRRRRDQSAERYTREDGSPK